MKPLTLQEKAEQWFENNSDCYADTWKDIGESPSGAKEMVEGEVIQAITKAKFLEFLTETATLFAKQACEMQKVKCASVDVPYEQNDGLKTMAIMRDCILKCDNVIPRQPLPAEPKV